MISPARNLHRALRTSGFLAVAGVALFAFVGISSLVSAGGQPTVMTTSHPAGSPIEVSISRGYVFWGQGENVDASTTVCTSQNATGEFPAVLPAGPTRGSEDLATVLDPAKGELVYLASSADPTVRNSVVTCAGPGLETVWLSKDVRTSVDRASAVGFLVASVVAALWAFVTLRITRPRAAS